MSLSYKIIQTAYKESFQSFITQKQLIELEKKYGGLTQNVPRNIISGNDKRDKNKILYKMQGGDRMKSQYHNYASLYEKYLNYFNNNDTLNFLEIGILTGIGLASWSDLYKNSNIFGFDIEPQNFYNNQKNLYSLGAFKHNQPKIYYYDQLDNNQQDYLNNIFKGHKLNIVIDDGCHTDDCIMTTLQNIIPHLANNFVYFIEDNRNVHTLIQSRYPQFNIEYKDQMTVLTPK